jgi:D-3-phosphoglycerate dehydrogenase
MPNVLFADHDFPDITLERDLFAAAGVSLVVQQCKTEDELIAAARDCKGMLIQYARITSA